MTKKSNSTRVNSLVTNSVKESPQKTVQKLQLNVWVAPKNEGQKQALEVIKNNTISVITGIAGCGKTHCAMGVGLTGLLQGKYEKLILTRPYVEAGEKMGYLPGDFNNKIAPFMQPLIEISKNMIGVRGLTEFLDKGNIQVLPFAYMRGVTFNKTFVIADETQNSTVEQMRMLLTRIGEDSKMVITGDLNQSDLWYDTNGLSDCISRLKGNVDGMGFYHIDDQYCVRSPIISQIEKLYQKKKNPKI